MRANTPYSVAISSLVVLLAATIMHFSFTSTSSAARGNTEDPKRVEEGDLVVVHYTASTESGLLVQTTHSRVDQDPKRTKAPVYRIPNEFIPEELVAGESGGFPKIGERVIGMEPGRKKSVTLSPEDAFGLIDPQKIVPIDRVKRMPRVGKLSPARWSAQFAGFPAVGQEINVTPYFKSRVTSVEPQEVTVEALPLAAGAETFQSGFGSVEIRTDGEEMVTTLVPRIGAAYELDGQKGRIVSADEKSFMVDLNPPLAGQPIRLDIELVKLTKASRFSKDISWMDNHDRGVSLGMEKKRPVALVLYADWCSWSKRLLTETMENPRIKMMRDKFVWVKVDSDKDKELKERYGQVGFPMVVLLNAKGEVVNKIDGFRDAAALKKELDEVLGIGAKGPRV